MSLLTRLLVSLTLNKMPFDPVRDAVLNSPVSQSYPLPSPHVLTAPQVSTSPPTSYFATNHAVSSQTAASTNAAAQSPSSARRATDLSVLLNSDDHAPSPTYQQRRPSSSSSALNSPSVGTPRPRSAHLSHILQPSGDDASPLMPPPPITASPISSPLLQNRDIIPPSLSRSRAPTAPAPARTPPSYQVDLPRRASSSSAGSMSAPRSPEITRSPLSKSTVISHNAPIQNPLRDNHKSRLSQRSMTPYAPRNRRTAPGSVLVPLSDAERDFYKTLSKNPLRGQATLGKRKFEDVSNDTLRPSSIDEPPHKVTHDVGRVVQHCAYSISLMILIH